MNSFKVCNPFTESRWVSKGRNGFSLIVVFAVRALVVDGVKGGVAQAEIRTVIKSEMDNEVFDFMGQSEMPIYFRNGSPVTFTSVSPAFNSVPSAK